MVVPRMHQTHTRKNSPWVRHKWPKRWCIAATNLYHRGKDGGAANAPYERLFLQRVGGRYRFIHRLIQERFAATGGHRL